MTTLTDISNAEFKGTVIQSLTDIRVNIKDVKDSLNELSTNFQALEAGRLSRLETKVANILVGVAIMAFLIPLLVSGIMQFLFK